MFVFIDLPVLTLFACVLSYLNFPNKTFWKNVAATVNSNDLSVESPIIYKGKLKSSAIIPIL